MKKLTDSARRNRRAFTLIELLVVIAIIGILAAILLPVFSRIKEQAKVKQAQMEINAISQAVQGYYSHYSRYPSTVPAGNNDFTYGGTSLQQTLGAGQWVTNNSEVIAILMDIPSYPANSAPTADANHVKNPEQMKLLDAKMVSDQNMPGVGPDLIYRDPWGNPYIISMDLNYDEKCSDSLYSLSSVSQQSGTVGYNGLTSPTGTGNDFEHNGGVMVWSLGPDKKASRTDKANQGVNRDNVLSWQ